MGLCARGSRSRRGGGGGGAARLFRFLIFHRLPVDLRSAGNPRPVFSLWPVTARVIAAINDGILRS